MAENEKKNVFVYYRGVKGRGKEIIQALRDLGGSDFNIYAMDEAADDPDCICYIDSDGDLFHAPIESKRHEWVMEHYTEAFLPDPPAKPDRASLENATLEPGILVLVRKDKRCEWLFDTFIRYEDVCGEYMFRCLSGYCFRYCVPYIEKENGCLFETTDESLVFNDRFIPEEAMKK